MTIRSPKSVAVIVLCILGILCAALIAGQDYEPLEFEVEGPNGSPVRCYRDTSGDILAIVPSARGGLVTSDVERAALEEALRGTLDKFDRQWTEASLSYVNEVESLCVHATIVPTPTPEPTATATAETLERERQMREAAMVCFAEGAYKLCSGSSWDSPCSYTTVTGVGGAETEPGARLIATNDCTANMTFGDVLKHSGETPFTVTRPCAVMRCMKNKPG